MNYVVKAPLLLPANAVVQLPSSKSISNRALILDALTGFKSKITNLSKANDTLVLQRMLKFKNGLVDAEDAGTALRFAAVYFSLIEGEHIIAGTERLMNRPMQSLIDALKQLGGNVRFKKVDGKKVLLIRGGKLKGGEVTVDTSESSQFISALLLCAPAMKNGLVVNLKGTLVSEPYIHMTLGLMLSVGIDYTYSARKITVPCQHIKPFKLRVESDWSSASYFYSLLSCVESGNFLLKGLSIDSLQGDSALLELMQVFGVSSVQKHDGILIEKRKSLLPKLFIVNCKDFPDVVPALTVAALCNKVEIRFKGVGHLRHKESDRVSALIKTAKQLDAKAKVDGKDGFTISQLDKFSGAPIINTYDDHRMAMSFATLATRYENVVIENALVVKKSFPNYWSELKKLGFSIQKV